MRHGSSQQLSTAIGATMRGLIGDSEAAAKAMRTIKVQDMWRGVVDPVFLDHTNAVFIIQEKGQKVLIVYVDESIYAAELNARRELIKLAFLEKYHEDLNEFRIVISRGDYKKNHPFVRPEEPQPLVEYHPQPLDEAKKQEIYRQVEAIEDERLRNALVKAMISDLELKSGIGTQN